MTRRTNQSYRMAAVLSRFHRSLYILLGGRFVSHRGKARFLLLTTKGRRSQRMRTVALLYLTRQQDLVVIASHGGNPKAPDWLLNIRDDPKIMVQTGAVHREGIARIATPAEREDLWPRFVDCYAGYEKYQAKTARRFPIVIITPDEG